jgi:hypothetical protein
LDAAKVIVFRVFVHKEDFEFVRGDRTAGEGKWLVKYDFWSDITHWRFMNFAITFQLQND